MYFTARRQATASADLTDKTTRITLSNDASTISSATHFEETTTGCRYSTETTLSDQQTTAGKTHVVSLIILLIKYQYNILLLLDYLLIDSGDGFIVYLTSCYFSPPSATEQIFRYIAL